MGRRSPCSKHARSGTALDEVKREILEAVQSTEMLVTIADVRHTQSAVVQALIERLGRLDILVANAGAINLIEQSTCCTLPLLF